MGIRKNIKILIYFCLIGLSLSACQPPKEDSDIKGQLFGLRKKNEDAWKKIQGYDIDETIDEIGKTGELENITIKEKKFEYGHYDENDEYVPEKVFSTVKVSTNSYLDTILKCVVPDLSENEEYVIKTELYTIIRNRDTDILSFYDKYGRLYKKTTADGQTIYQDVTNIEATKNGLPKLYKGDSYYKISDTEIIVKSRVGDGEDGYIFIYYTPEGRYFKKTALDGEVLETKQSMLMFNGTTYLRGVDGKRNNNTFVIVDKNLGVEGTKQAYLKGEYSHTIEKKELLDSLKLEIDEASNAQRIAKTIGDNELAKISYNLATKHAKKKTGSTEEAKYITDLIGVDGYAELEEINIGGSESLNNINKLDFNPYVRIGINQVCQTYDFNVLKDSAGIAHIFTKSEAENYITDSFNTAYSNIINSTDKATANSYRVLVSSIKVIDGKTENKNELRELIDTYTTQLKSLITEIYSNEN